jgi:hypothetical protein
MIRWHLIKDYLFFSLRYFSIGKTLMKLVGVGFDIEARNIRDYQIEEVK